MIFLLFSSSVKIFLTLQGHSKAFESKVACASTISLFWKFGSEIPGDIVGKLSILSCLEVPPKPALGWVDGNCS